MGLLSSLHHTAVHCFSPLSAHSRRQHNAAAVPSRPHLGQVAEGAAAGQVEEQQVVQVAQLAPLQHGSKCMQQLRAAGRRSAPPLCMLLRQINSGRRSAAAACACERAGQLNLRYCHNRASSTGVPQRPTCHAAVTRLSQVGSASRMAEQAAAALLPPGSASPSAGAACRVVTACSRSSRVEKANSADAPAQKGGAASACPSAASDTGSAKNTWREEDGGQVTACSSSSSNLSGTATANPASPASAREHKDAPVPSQHHTKPSPHLQCQIAQR